MAVTGLRAEKAMARQNRAPLFLKELLRGHLPDLIAVVSGIGFWFADHPEPREASLWGLSVVGVLLGLLFYILRDAFLTTTALSGVAELPYSIVTDKPIEEAELLFTNHAHVLTDKGIRLTRIFERFLISGSDWHYYDQNRIDDKKWRELVRNIRAHFVRLSKRVSAPARYHLFFVTPPAVALGLGAVLGRDIRWRAYQYFGPEHFEPVFNPEQAGEGESYHRLQTIAQEYKEIKITSSGDPDASDVAILLQFVAHPLSPIAALFSSPLHQLFVSHTTFSSHIPAEHNWMRVAVEISSLVRTHVGRGKTVHLFFGLPASLAFAVGNFISDHNPIRVYHHDKKRNQYVKVFSLNELM
jgi:hypothetical protein